MNKVLTGRVLTLSIDNIQFDPEDEQSQNFNRDTCVYYIHLNMDLIGQISKDPSQKEVNFEMTPKVLNDPQNVIRILVKDHGCPLPEGDFAQVGCISLNIEYFKNIPEQ